MTDTATPVPDRNPTLEELNAHRGALAERMGIEVLEAAADKVVGKAAAFLYVRLGVTHVYAPVMSEPARAVLTAHGIEAAWDTCPPAIRNRAGDGYCPMERAVWDLTDPAEAEKAVRRTLAALTAAKG